MDALTIGLGTMGALAAGLSKFVSGASSARNVQQTSLSGMDSSIASAVDRIAGISNANSAWNAAQAQQQRNWSMQQSQQAMQFNAQQAAQQRQWLEYMSSTAHQREVADLKAAGLNPVLSATGGNGAAVPSGASASAVLPSGASAQADQTANAAIVSLLGHFLQAQNNLQMADVSAKTNLAVADKYNAMSQFVAELSRQTELERISKQFESSKYATDVGARNAALAAYAQQAAAGINAAALRYGYDISDLINQRNIGQEVWRLENYPNNMYQVLDNLVNTISSSGKVDGSESIYGSSISGKAISYIEDMLVKLIKKSENGTYPIAQQWIDKEIGKERKNRSTYNGSGSGRGF